jgi:signal transduction histidine kinase
VQRFDRVFQLLQPWVILLVKRLFSFALGTPVPLAQATWPVVDGEVGTDKFLVTGSIHSLAVRFFRLWMRCIRRSMLGLLLGVVVFGAQASRADSPIQERAWFEDHSGVLTWEEVKSQEFKSYTGLLGRGFGSTPIWIRLLGAPRLQGEPVGSAGRYILRIKPAHLDEIELFDPLDVSGAARRTGDLYPWGEDEYPSLYFNFSIPQADAPRYIWLRLKSSRSRLIDVEALSDDDVRQSDILQEMLSAAYLGVLVLFFGWALNVYLNAPEKLLALFVLKQFWAMVFALFGLGYARLLLDGHLSPGGINTLSDLSMIVYVFFGLAYQLSFAKEMRPPAWVLRLFRIAFYLVPVELLLLVTGNAMAAVALSAGSVLFAAMVGILITILAKYPESGTGRTSVFVAKPLMIGAHALILSSVLLGVLPTMGWTDAPRVLVHVPMTHALLSGILLMWILQVRAHRLLLRQAHNEAQLLALNEKVSTERKHREEQQHLLAMLAHELKTPLSAISMMLDRFRATPETVQGMKLAINEMNVIVNRCVQAGRMADKKLELHRTAFDPLVVLEDVIRSRHGDALIQCAGTKGLKLISDEQVVRMLLSNLLENACRYGAPGEVVHVSLAPHAEAGVKGVLFVFSNAEGPAGRPDPERVFSKYYRAPHARRQTGSGLGLYLVAGFSSRLGGTVRYVPDPVTIRFELWLPL